MVSKVTAFLMRGFVHPFDGSPGLANESESALFMRASPMLSAPLIVTDAVAGSVLRLRRPPSASTSSHFGRDSRRWTCDRGVVVLVLRRDAVDREGRG